ncbi:MAG: hypothetical protein JW737_00515 [Acidobacteria bacterium]|nr:hypothetical protein [Acidobacteriota bacterium]
MNRIVKLLVITFLSFFIADLAAGTDMLNRKSLSLTGGFGLSIDGEISSALSMRAGATFPLGPFSIGLTAQIESLNTSPDDYGLYSMSKGSPTATTFLLRLSNEMYLSKDITYYLAYGAGYSIYSSNPDNPYEQFGYSIEEDLDGSVAFVGGVGANILVSSDLALNIEINYILTSIEGSWIVTDTRSSSLMDGIIDTNLNRLSMNIGLRLYWGETHVEEEDDE